jgi:phosphoglycolate phosphatase
MLVKRAAPQDTPDDVVRAVELAFKEHYDQNWQNGTIPYKGVPEVLAELQRRGHPMAVLSNKPHPFTTVIVKRLFPRITFDAVVGQREGIPHKPDPAGALEVVRVFGLPPEDCVLVGDSTIDLETARNAGIRSVAVTWGYHDRGPLVASGPDGIIDDVRGLAEAFEE